MLANDLLNQAKGWVKQFLKLGSGRYGDGYYPNKVRYRLWLYLRMSMIPLLLANIRPWQGKAKDEC